MLLMPALLLTSICDVTFIDSPCLIILSLSSYTFSSVPVNVSVNLKSSSLFDTTSNTSETFFNCSSVKDLSLAFTLLSFTKSAKAMFSFTLFALSLTVKLRSYALSEFPSSYVYFTVELSVAFESAVADDPEITLSPFFTVIVSNGKPLVGALSVAVTFITIVSFE